MSLRFSDSRQMVKPLLLLLVFLSSVTLMTSLNYPYRPFPTDELWSYSSALVENDWLASKSEILLNSPMHIYSLLAVKQLVRLLGMHWFQTFLVTVAISINVTAVLLGFTVHAASGNIFAGLWASLLVLVSAWAQSYLHFYTYAPVAGMFMMASLFCFARCYFSDRGSNRLAAACGICAGLFFLSGSACKLLAGILIVSYISLILCSALPRKIAHSVWLAAAALVPVMAFMPIYLEPLWAHLATNISAGNGIECLQKYGFLPKTPFFSFMYLLSVYSAPLLLLLIFSIVIAVLRWKKLLQLGRPGVFVLTLFGVVILHTVVLDLLPFTKLGRAQYPVLLIALLAMALLYAALQMVKPSWKWVFPALVLIAVPLELSTDFHTWQARRTAPLQLQQLPAGTAFIVLNEDPHHEFITSWLNYDSMYTASKAELAQLIRTRTTPVALIAGPTGPNSGKSILKNCVMDDFYFVFPADVDIMPKSVQKLPYYAHYPLFMMEEETSQYFFFKHQIPRQNDPQSRLTVYFWPDK